MSKRAKNSPVEQVMEELNEDLQASLNTSVDLFTPDFMDQLEKTGARENTEQKDLPTGLSSSALRLVEDKAGAEEGAEEGVEEEVAPVAPKKKVQKKPKIMVLNKKAKKSSLNKKHKPANKSSAEMKKASLSPINISMGGENKAFPVSGFEDRQVMLRQSEHLKVAQDRINSLEGEIDRLRTENEELLVIADNRKESLDKRELEYGSLQNIYGKSKEEFQEERNILEQTLKDQGREIEKLNRKNKEWEKRLLGNFQQIKVRERELENRLELMKLDNQTLIREKDKYILDLKRDLDKLRIDKERQLEKYEEASKQLESYKGQNRRVLHGLKMIMHISRESDYELGNTSSFSDPKPAVASYSPKVEVSSQEEHSQEPQDSYEEESEE